jgi:predicted AAA+ superfamily ATPase
LAKTFNPDHLFDLENPRDFEIMGNPQIALENIEGLIMIDEIQRKPEIFTLLRYLVDNKPNQKYLILGSASSNLKQQSGESLAGRIGYYYLTGFNISESGIQACNDLWLRGGFPRSFLSKSDSESMIWRSNFISTFLEKDLALLGIKIPSSVMFRFWTMISHYHGQVLNYSELGRSFGITDKTIKNYISILEDTFMLRVLMPWHTNVGKRLVKSPKLYIRDSGIFHSLQSIQSTSELKSNPKLGASWEGFALEELITLLGKTYNELFFYASHSGQELDLFWQQSGKNFGAEFKYIDAPKMTKSMHQSIEDLTLEKLWIIYPGDKLYPLSDKTTVIPVTQLHLM